jgi:hypothetical protein
MIHWYIVGARKLACTDSSPIISLLKRTEFFPLYKKKKGFPPFFLFIGFIQNAAILSHIFT